MRNSFQLFYHLFNSGCECLYICSHNWLEVQLNAVISRFPLELTFPVGLRAYSIFENVMEEPKAQLVHGEFHRYLFHRYIMDKCFFLNKFLSSGSNHTHVKNKIYFLHHLVRFIEGEEFHVTKQESFNTQVI